MFRPAIVFVGALSLGCSSSSDSPGVETPLADAGTEQAFGGSAGEAGAGGSAGETGKGGAAGEAGSSGAAGDSGTAGTAGAAGAAVNPPDPFPPTCTASCSGSQVCVGDDCCPAATPTGAFSLPAHTSYVRWTFTAGGVTAVEFVLYIGLDPGEKVGLYFAPYNAYIDGTMFYLGIQTNVNRPEVGPTGKGFLFSRWDSLDPADTRAEPDGFIEVGTHEGEFVGVRRNYPWTIGTYVLRLQRAEQDGDRDWFDFTVTEQATSTTTKIGGLRFARKYATVPARIASAGTAFTEVYSGAEDYAAVPQWHLQVMGYGDQKRAVHARSEYPAYPTAEYPNTDVFYQASSDWIHLTYGGMTPRCHKAGNLF